jgi:hypothetical protein
MCVCFCFGLHLGLVAWFCVDFCLNESIFFRIALLNLHFQIWAILIKKSYELSVLKSINVVP